MLTSSTRTGKEWQDSFVYNSSCFWWTLPHVPHGTGPRLGNITLDYSTDQFWRIHLCKKHQRWNFSYLWGTKSPRDRHFCTQVENGKVIQRWNEVPWIRNQIRMLRSGLIANGSPAESLSRRKTWNSVHYLSMKRLQMFHIYKHGCSFTGHLVEKWWAWNVLLVCTQTKPLHSIFWTLFVH